MPRFFVSRILLPSKVVVDVSCTDMLNREVPVILLLCVSLCSMFFFSSFCRNAPASGSEQSFGQERPTVLGWAAVRQRAEADQPAIVTPSTFQPALAHTLAHSLIQPPTSSPEPHTPEPPTSRAHCHHGEPASEPLARAAPLFLSPPLFDHHGAS